jgi:hypothetical protein
LLRLSRRVRAEFERVTGLASRSPRRLRPRAVSAARPGSSARESCRTRSMVAPRPALLALTFLITLLWFMANLRQWSPLDALPFGWTWLTLWLVVSVGQELCRRSRDLSASVLQQARQAFWTCCARIAPIAESMILSRPLWRGYRLSWFRRPQARRQPTSPSDL